MPTRVEAGAYLGGSFCATTERCREGSSTQGRMGIRSAVPPSCLPLKAQALPLRWYLKKRTGDFMREIFRPCERRTKASFQVALGSAPLSLLLPCIPGSVVRATWPRSFGSFCQAIVGDGL
ncbi:Hypothetical predicted protein [Pelobates cultripes]|uniref:Uncharacterized protein n=1 Tax=Pelobates cultripes TaxID=61616 RepID=A0AAD1RW92_PELCU|nr:Hypothetical predicted protein [Pelobates cultripes]